MLKDMKLEIAKERIDNSSSYDELLEIKEELTGVVVPDHHLIKYIDSHISTEGLFLKSDIEKKEKGTATSTKIKDMRNKMETGDILLVYTPKRALKRMNWKVNILKFAVDLIMRSKYSSIKLVLSKDEIIGYGSRVKKDNNFSKVDAKNYLGNTQTAVLIRHRNITKSIQKKIKKEALKREDIKYAFDQTVKSLLGRLTFEKIFSPMQSEEDKLNELPEEYTEPMLCSSIIALLYKISGLPIDTGMKHIHNVWPDDILLSDDMEIIQRLER